MNNSVPDSRSTNQAGNTPTFSHHHQCIDNKANNQTHMAQAMCFGSFKESGFIASQKIKSKYFDYNNLTEII